jgi:hypothetical protein
MSRLHSVSAAANLDKRKLHHYKERYRASAYVSARNAAYVAAARTAYTSLATSPILQQHQQQAAKGEAAVTTYIDNTTLHAKLYTLRGISGGASLCSRVVCMTADCKAIVQVALMPHPVPPPFYW